MQVSTLISGQDTVSGEPRTVPANAVAQSSSANFGRAATAILVTMVLLIVALTGILVETTLHSPSGQLEVPSSVDPGSFAGR
jgi:hypothetical protein